MNRIIVLFVSFFLIINGLLNAQNLSQKLGSIKTDFKFYSDTIDLNVSNQFIIKNAGAFFSYNATSGSSYGFGAGYESYHLEFVTNKILKCEYFKRYTNSAHYEIDFFDSTNIKLSTISFTGDEIVIFTNSDVMGSPIFYSIDLYNVPISLLDRTLKMNIKEFKEKEK
jgi:hypothetical protein